MREIDPERQPWILRLRIRNNAEQCVKMIMNFLKGEGFQMSKDYERKRKISEAEVTAAAYDGFAIDNLLVAISEWEVKLKAERSAETFDHLQALYQKAIEFYSAQGKMEEMKQALNKLQEMFSEPAIESTTTPAATTPGESSQQLTSTTSATNAEESKE